MTYGRIIDGVYYICLVNDNDFKKKSLEDNVYFTLRDIFANAESLDTAIEANSFNTCLTNGISFEDRTNSFEYTNMLYEMCSVSELNTWLKWFKKDGWFEFQELEEDEQIDMREYMKFDDWWVQFEELRNSIDTQYVQCFRYWQMLSEEKKIIKTIYKG